MGTTIMDVAPATPETAMACEATPPALLVHITHFPAARGLRHSPLSVRIDDPQHAARMAELEDRLSAETATDAAHRSGEAFLSGRISRCVALGLYAASAPAGKTQKFLGYFPSQSMAVRAVEGFELAAGLGPIRRSHKKKLVGPVRDREGSDSTP